MGFEKIWLFSKQESSGAVPALFLRSHTYSQKINLNKTTKKKPLHYYITNDAQTPIFKLNSLELKLWGLKSMTDEF